jgi:hypothetical protein
MSRTVSIPKMFSGGAVRLTVLTLIASGCGPVTFKLDETRATGACRWSEHDSGIACVSYRHSDHVSQHEHDYFSAVPAEKEKIVFRSFHVYDCSASCVASSSALSPSVRLISFATKDKLTCQEISEFGFAIPPLPAQERSGAGRLLNST